MSDDKRCTCYARMAGECMCGAWDDAADDERAARLAEEIARDFREQLERLTRENEHLRGLIFDKDQLLQLHDLPRDGGPLVEHLAFERNRLRSQLSAVKAARDEACDLLDGLSDESIELEQRVRIAELRKVGD